MSKLWSRFLAKWLRRTTPPIGRQSTRSLPREPSGPAPHIALPIFSQKSELDRALGPEFSSAIFGEPQLQSWDARLPPCPSSDIAGSAPSVAGSIAESVKLRWWVSIADDVQLPQGSAISIPCA
jgi:hypothetical protein